MAKLKHVPIRTCVGCGEKRPKGELLRIVKEVNGGILPDPSGKKSGRGAYICFNLDCLESALKKKAIQRSLKINDLDDSLLREIKEIISKKRNGLEGSGRLCPKG